MSVYNGEKYLSLTLRHVLNQTYKNFEFLIVDDCSTDRSVEMIQSLRDPRIRLIRNEVNQGQTKSLNIGLKLACGEYVARMDADDLAFPQWLQKQLEFMDHYPQCVVGSNHAVIIDAQGKMKKTLRPPTRREDIFLRAITTSPINHGGCFMRRDIVLKEGGYNESFRVAADYDLWSRLLRKGYSLMTLPEIATAIRVHEGSVSITERGRKDFEEMSLIMEENIRAFTTVAEASQKARIIWRLIYTPEALTKEVFEKAVQSLEEVYAHCKPQFSISSEFAQSVCREKISVVYIKRIFFFINTNENVQVHYLAREYLRDYGINHIFLALWFLSFLGKWAIGFLPSFYEKFSMWRTGAPATIRWRI